jgi:hypothetical protein
MSNLDPPPLDRTAGRSGDELDALLRAFFQAEMPRPWPALDVPDRSRRVSHRNGTTSVLDRVTLRTAPSRAPLHGRLALAASVILLLAGTLFLSGKFSNQSSPELSGSDWSAKKYQIKESILQEIDEKPGPDGKPSRQDHPTKYLIEFYPQR